MGSPANTMISADKEKGKAKCLSGFIFLCNQRTKLECYRYRVFGLPFSQKHVVEEIKSGMKLFLYDFELKLLYGVYEATSAGSLNLEPSAFGGKFPAQVKFKIFKECLPIPESSLRYVIKENYSGSKFKQELCRKLVKKVISSFRPLPAPLCNPGLHAPENVLPVAAMPHRRAAYVENALPTLNHQSFPAANHYASHPQQRMLAKDVVHQMQMHESSYSRYPIVEQRPLHDEFARYHQLPQHRKAFYQHNVPSHNSRLTATDIYTPSYHHLPSQGGQYQDNVLSHNYSSTATDMYTPSHHQLPSQGRQYQDMTAAHGSYCAAPVQCATSDYSQVDPAYFPSQREASHQDNVTAFNSNLTAIAQYASSILQRPEPVPYDQSSLRGTQYQDSIQGEAQYIPGSQATYLPVEREASFQDNVVPYNSDPIVPSPSQSASICQPQVSATNLHVQSEASHQVYMGVYNSNPIVAGPYVPVGQQDVLPYASAPVSPYYPYPGH